VYGFLAANVIGAVVGIGLIVAKRADRQSQVPYGVFLAAGTALAVFTGPEVLSHWS
jgi:prepilin signal peptidase PulO-like enzyme (type II secretory pathway)